MTDFTFLRRGFPRRRKRLLGATSFQTLETMWNSLEGDLSSRCGAMAGYLEQLAREEGHPPPYPPPQGGRGNIRENIVVGALIGSLERLRWLADNRFETHPFEGVFLTGSLSYGRFFSIDPMHSDIDLLVIYGAGGIAACLANLPETLRAEIPPDLLAHLSVIEEEDRPELYAIHLHPRAQSFPVSITAVSPEALESVLRPEPGALISAWRDRSIPVEALILKDMAGRVVTIPFEQALRQRGSLLTVCGYLRHQGIMVPNGYQNLIMPRMEYMGRLSESVRRIVTAFAEDYRKAVAETRQAGFSVEITASHLREARMPETLKAMAEALIAHGPRVL